MRKILIFLLLCCGTVEASTLDGLRSRLSHYLSDSSNMALPAYIKDSTLNVAMREYTGSYPVLIDTVSVITASGTRIYTVDASGVKWGGQVLSVHKDNANFTVLKQMPPDSTPTMEDGIIQFWSSKPNMLILHPRPIAIETVFVFYTIVGAHMTTGATECPLSDYLEEPIVLLAAAKCWKMKDLTSTFDQKFYADYERVAAKLTRTTIEKAEGK